MAMNPIFPAMSLGLYVKLKSMTRSGAPTIPSQMQVVYLRTAQRALNWWEK